MVDSSPGLRSGATPLAVRMRPTSLDEVAGPAPPAHAGVAARRPRRRSNGRVRLGVGHPLGAARHGQDHPRAGDRPVVGSQVRRALRRLRRRARRPPGDGGGAGQPRPLRTLHRPLPRRDPPLHEGPAGRAAARRRERLGHPRRGHHREPLVLRHLPAALAVAPAHARAPHRRRPRHAGRSRGGRSARAGGCRRARARRAGGDRPARLRRRQARAHGARGGIRCRGAGRGRRGPNGRRSSGLRRRRRRRGVRRRGHRVRSGCRGGRSPSSPPRWWPAPSTARCCATTATATSTTTSSARSSSRCAAATSTPPCTTSPA